MIITKFVGIISLMAFVALACGCPSNKRIDQVWHQPGKDYVDVKKALLECGFSDFSNGMDPSIDYLAASVCLERLGYVKEKHWTKKSPVCTNEWFKDDPSCQPNAVIPTPSVERRLKSKYCQSPYYRDREECQP
jgi:hypothetical protein